MKIMTALLMIFFVSCQNAPKIPPKISCDTTLIESVDYPDHYTGRCLCRCLDLNDPSEPLKDFSYCDGRYSGPSVRFSLRACHQIVGFKLKTYAEEIRPWLIEVKEYCEDTRKGL
jgi:hypothetical protein